MVRVRAAQRRGFFVHHLTVRMHVCTLARWRVRPWGGAAVFYLLHRGGHRPSLAVRACSTRSEWPAWMRARRRSRGGLPPVRFFFFGLWEISVSFLFIAAFLGSFFFFFFGCWRTLRPHWLCCVVA
ncbi:hypothetical protein Tc00.1047053510889.130 [Trypanosoma cruzi]|uniref:Uncharacterized protein n=1 Tax=Trypanosoma cruzi (strain CL Brener) TaxID=353153 RepID=Q4E2N7_TRYCC|nr:hypothetical protein Tc00.1047053510889.130 [Trypanosoma cruzi]EAN99026.1 hypothetical protein Tc00.1047053510889.130 [Trypanosoma cruzi]|eukprot:XP_820877.1 hypothetical protein [Trypanosoma cruzi strain CL Brener]